MPSSADQVSANVELMRATTDAFNAHDLDACERRITPNFIIHLAGLEEPLHGRKTWRQNAEIMQRAFPDLTAQIDGVVAAEDQVALRLTFSGTHAGGFLGHAPTGRTVRYVSHEVYRIEDALVAEEWICSDMASLMQQVSCDLLSEALNETKSGAWHEAEHLPHNTGRGRLRTGEGVLQRAWLVACLGG